MTIEHFPNKTQNEEYKLPCQKCAGKTTHKALVTFDERGSEENENWSMFWSIDHQIVQCLGCQSISFRIASSDSENTYHIGEDEFGCTVEEKLYPPRLEGRKGIGLNSFHLPLAVRLLYDETLTALSVQTPILAAIGLRALIEAVCQEKNAEGNDLLKRIQNLVAQQVLTPSSAAILQKIRTLGNTAAHEAKPHSEKQLALAMDIVEHMLKDVYILPKQATSEFSDEI